MTVLDRVLTRIGKFLFGPDDYPAMNRLQQVVNNRSDQDVLCRYLDQTFMDEYGPMPNPHISYKNLAEKGATFPKAKDADYSYRISVQPPPPVSKKKTLLTFIKAHSPKGITAEQVGRAFPAWRYSTISARISELYKAGTIVAVGTAQTDTGALAKLYAVAQEG